MPGWSLRILSRCKEETQWTSSCRLKSNISFKSLWVGQRPPWNGRALPSLPEGASGFLLLGLENDT